jgi:SAM-dependent methyltransferase
MAHYNDIFQTNKENISFDELFKDQGFSKAFGEERDKNIRPVIDFISQKMNLENILFCDIGAGYGSLSIPLSMLGARGVAGDISEYCLKAIQKRCMNSKLSKLQTVRMDAFNGSSLSFKTSIFDLVLLNGVIEYAGLSTDNNPEYIQMRLLKEIYRVLKKGGYLYLATENRFAANYFFGKGHDGLLFSSLMPRKVARIYSRITKRSDYFMREFSYPRLRNLLREIGFGNIDFYGGIRSYNNPKKIMDLENRNILGLYGKKFIKRRFSRLGLRLLLLTGMQKLFWPNFIVLCKK